MNRSIAWVGIGVILAGIGLVAFPIFTTGQEQLDPEQIVGFLAAPVGLFVVLIAAVSVDPYHTTVSGAFGNPDEPVGQDSPAPATVSRGRLANPFEPVYCRFCRALIAADLSRCPRCDRARECRNCRRPLGQVLDRPTCPTCARAEPFCDCPLLAHHPALRVGRPMKGSVE